MNNPGAFRYDAMIGSECGTGTRLPATTGRMLVGATETPIDVRYLQYTSGTKVHGPLLGVGKHAETPDLSFIWFDSLANSDFQVTVTFPAAGSYSNGDEQPAFVFLDWEIVVYRFGKKSVEKVSTLYSTGTLPLVPVTKSICALNTDALDPGYYALSLTITGRGITASDKPNTPLPRSSSLLPSGLPSVTVAADVIAMLADVAVNVSCGSTTTSDNAWSHNMLPDFDKNVYSMNQIRNLGASQMLSQRASSLTAMGTITQGQLPPSSNWTEYVSSGYAELAKLKNFDSGRNAKKGAYGFIKPSQIEEFEMQNMWETENSNIKILYFRLLPKDGFLVTYCITGQTEAEFALAPPNMIWTLWDSLEFLTDNQIFDTRLAVADKNMVERAFMSVRHIQQFHDNDNHLGSIFRSFLGFGKKALGKVMEYGPAALKGAEMLSSMA
jgi:hypothetical protein